MNIKAPALVVRWNKDSGMPVYRRGRLIHRTPVGQPVNKSVIKPFLRGWFGDAA